MPLKKGKRQTTVLKKHTIKHEHQEPYHTIYCRRSERVSNFRSTLCTRQIMNKVTPRKAQIQFLFLFYMNLVCWYIVQLSKSWQIDLEFNL